MNYKKLTATLLTATLVVANVVPVLADPADPGAPQTVSGNGGVEYDDSEAIEYDSITVATLTDGAYAFTLDPTHQLSKYDWENYSADKSVYFTAETVKENIKPAEGVTLKTAKKVPVTAVAASTPTKWNGIVTATAQGTDPETYSYTFPENTYYVWVPDSAYTSGKSGRYELLTPANYTNWFVPGGTNAAPWIQLKNGYNAGSNPCDGNIYEIGYDTVPAAGITENATIKVDDYVTITSGAISAIKNVYYVDTNDSDKIKEVPIANVDDYIVYTAPENSNTNSTTEANMVNKSTKTKVVTANITMSNVEGLKFVSENGLATSTDASVYFAAMGGAAPVAFAKASDDADKATAVYSVEVEEADKEEITYMTNETNANTGGHKYARYEAAGTTYTPNSFYITAVANTNTDDDTKAAWEEYGSKLAKGEYSKPEIKIVYSVTDKQTTPADVAPSIATIEYDYDRTADLQIPVSLGTGDKIATAVTGVAWSTASDGTYSDFAKDSKWTYSDSVVTFKSNIWGSKNVNDEFYLKITFNDSDTTSRIVKLTIVK